MKTAHRILLAIALAGLAACGSRDAAQAAALAPGTVQPWVLPAPPGSSAPALALAPDGRLLVSWLNQPAGRRPALQFAALNREGAWQSQPRTVAVGHALVVDAADPPTMQATPDGALWMQWLQHAGAQGQRELMLVRSRDGGMQWSEPVRVDAGGADASSSHVALWPHGPDALGIAWLEAPTAAAGGDARLQSARLDMDLAASGRSALEARACGAGGLATAISERGPLLAWRERGNHPGAGVALARGDAAGWSRPLVVAVDGRSPPDLSLIHISSPRD